MSEEADYLKALEMQIRWNAEANEDSDSDVAEIKDFTMPPPSKKPLQIMKQNKYRSNLDEDFLNRTQNLVHPQWETLDPTPDVFSLFGAFDSKFFQGRLKCVTLEWSKKMYSCAGICYSRRNRFGMDVTIRLSEPLLKLRPRKDLIETMLHEMIHAYCFVLNIREGNGGHGPNFKKIMYGINKVAGTNITVYHTFHDEVEVYKQHWWRCNGICQNRSPFFGYVKRTSNRAPSFNDQWWAAHLESCGGTFMKIKGPEKPKKENKLRKGKGAPTAGTDLRKFFKTTPKNSPIGAKINSISSIDLHSKGPIKINGGGTMLLNPKVKRLSNTQTSANPSTASSIAAALPPTSYPGLSTDPFNTNINTARTSAFAPPGGNLRNVMSFRDLNTNGSSGNPGRVVSVIKTNTSSNNAILGRGYALDSGGLKSTRNTISKATTDGQVDRNHLRSIWANRFGDSSVREEKNKANSNSEFIIKSNSGRPVRRYDNDDDNRDSSAGDSKRRRLSSPKLSTNSNPVYVVDEDESKKCHWQVLDDEVMLRDQPVETIAIMSDDDDEDDTKPMTADQRQQAIKKEIVDDDETMVIKDEDIILIDDEYNDDEDSLDISVASELADTSIIDEFFGEDTLLKDFKCENDVVPRGSRQVSNPDDDIITCPICQGKMKRCLFEEHLNGCTGIVRKVLAPKHVLKKLSATSREVKPTRRPRAPRQLVKDLLRNAGYTTADLQNISSSEEAEQEADYLSSSGASLNTSPPNLRANSTSIHDLTALDGETKLNRQRSIYKTTIQCPKCAQEVEQSEINEHLDDCLTN